MDEEMAENQKEVEKDLRQDLDLAASRYNELQMVAITTSTKFLGTSVDELT